jgi:ABC-type phosphate/phosphonate transport system permease subunit
MGTNYHQRPAGPLADLLTKVLAALFGIGFAILLAIPLAVFDAYCRIEKWLDNR